MVTCYIKENSFIAKLAARKLKAQSVAIVIGKTIHLHNTNRQQFMANRRWVRHELAHVKQFHEHGFVLFLLKYLLESVRNGYRNNRFEIEARSAENDLTLESVYLFDV